MQLQSYKNIANSINTKIVILKFVEEVYKIKAIIVFAMFTRFIVKHCLFDLT